MNILFLQGQNHTEGLTPRDLCELGHEVQCVAEEDIGVALASCAFDLLILHHAPPVRDRLPLVSQLRQDGQAVPIVLLTDADGRAETRAAALNAGADECLTPPFVSVELAARLKAVARRATSRVVESTLRAEDIEIDLLHRRVWRQGQPIRLQSSEFRLLEQLVRHAGKTVTKTMLLERVWAYDFDPATSVVQTQVSRLRAKLNRGFTEDAIRTVRGAGYRIGSPSI